MNRGELIYVNIGRNLACLAMLSQDLFLDYHNFLCFCQEVERQWKGLIKYCVIGMDFYRLWYDLSLSEERMRMLCFYGRTGCMHNYHDMDSLVNSYGAGLATELLNAYMEEIWG